jgi:HTH-type transcriptional regulator/antitoxin HigA
MANYDYEVPIPGMYIQEELDARGWTQRDLAFILDVQEPDLNKIIKGKVGVSFEMSKALAKAFDVDPDFFANLQKAYDFSHAKDPDPGVEQRASLQKIFPVREMIRRGWLKDVPASELEAELASFFRAANSNQIGNLAHAARKTNSGESATPTQLAWLYRVRQVAEQLPCKPYSASGLVDGQHRLHALMSAPEEIRHVPNFFAECGVRLIFVEGLTGGKIDGVCFWLDNKSPVIGMSIRFDRIDNFWFVLRHECEHVIRRHGQHQEIIDVNVQEEREGLSQEEEQANKAAAEFCVPQHKLASFIARKSPLISERDVINFAKMMGVHPGIVVGQLQKHTGRWDFLKRQQAKIRHLITRTAIVDGWGHVAPVHL